VADNARSSKSRVPESHRLQDDTDGHGVKIFERTNVAVQLRHLMRYMQTYGYDVCDYKVRHAASVPFQCAVVYRLTL